MSYAIGIEHNKKSTNLGTLMRSAYNFDASMVFTIGRRYDYQSSDTVKAYRHIPLIYFSDWKDFHAHIPMAWQPIGIEITENAHSLANFVHPKQAIYILGAEDYGLSKEALQALKTIVYIPSKHCLNVSVAGSIIMYDRQAKSRGKG